jgi:hypothetical protein
MTRRLGGLTAAGVLLLAGGAHALARPGTIQVTDAESAHTYVDLGPRGAGPGDLDIYKLTLFNKRITPKSIGHAGMVCTTVAGKTQSCTATYFFPKGQIVAEGMISSRLIYALAVVGGTGLYNNVRGTLTVTSLNRKPSKELLVFRLVV